MVVDRRLLSLLHSMTEKNDFLESCRGCDHFIYICLMFYVGFVHVKNDEFAHSESSSPSINIFIFVPQTETCVLGIS